MNLYLESVDFLKYLLIIFIHQNHVTVIKYQQKNKI